MKGCKVLMMMRSGQEPGQELGQEQGRVGAGSGKDGAGQSRARKK